MAESKGRILIVDDEADTCANLSDIFSDLGYFVDTAHDGPSALKLVESNQHYDVALLDLRMPGMDGLELYRRLKTKSAGTAALIVTAYASSETAKLALAAGADQLVSKPVNIEHLLGIVEEALNRPLILLVDDDWELCENLWEIFHERGYRVHLAHSVDDASRTLENVQFQVILLDMKLPGGDARDVLKLVREKNPEAQTVLITGYTHEMESRIQQSLAEGATAVAYKPFDVAQLLNTVAALSKAASTGAS